jgi:peroxiredoxin
MTLRIGDQVGDVELLRPDGTPVGLSEFTGRPLVVVFLRHLA